MFIKSTLKTFWHNAKGNTAIIFALGAIPLVMAAGAAVDTGRAYRARILLQGATDSAALAAAGSVKLTDAQITALVNAYLDANGATNILHQIGKISVDPNRTAGSMTVSITGYVQTSLMGVVGVDSMQVSAKTEVSTGGSQGLEIALALDNTGSMEGQKIKDLIESANLLVDELSGGESRSPGLKIGLVPFAQYVNVGDGNINASWMNVPASKGGKSWSGCVGVRNDPLDRTVKGTDPYPGILDVDCPSAITPLTENLNQVRAGIKKMEASGATYIPGGLLWGWNVLEHNLPFDEAMPDAERQALGGKRVLVLMTDGENTVIPTYPDLSYFTHFDPDRVAKKARANANTTELCGAVKAEGIELYTIAFQVTSTETKDLLKACASDPTMAFDAGNGAALKDAFRRITVKLASLHISK